MLSTFITSKLPFVFKTFVLSIFEGQLKIVLRIIKMVKIRVGVILYFNLISTHAPLSAR